VLVRDTILRHDPAYDLSHDPAYEVNKAPQEGLFVSKVQRPIPLRVEDGGSTILTGPADSYVQLYKGPQHNS